MTGRTHDAIAFASLITAAAFFPPEHLTLTTLVFAVVGADIGGMLPDIDQAGNKLWELLPSGNKVGRIFRRVFYKHRTLTHSAIGIIAIYNLLDYFLPKILNSDFVDPQVILASIMIGYYSHLASDALTEEGIPLLFPINASFGFPPVRSWRIKTGQWFENFVAFPSVWIYIIWFIHEKKDVLIHILKLVNS